MRNEKGLAISILLVAVALLAALAIDMAASSRTHSQSGQHKAKLLAGIILDQANLMSNGFSIVQSNGFALDQVTFDALNPQGLFNPKNHGRSSSYPRQRRWQAASRPCTTCGCIARTACSKAQGMMRWRIISCSCMS